MEGAAASRSAGILTSGSSALLGLLPSLTCAACWPAYSAALSALGLGFVDYTPYLLPLTALFVALSLGALAWTAWIRGDFRPLVLGALGGGALLVGRFALESDVVTYAAIALLVIAPFVARRRRAAVECARCVPAPAAEIRT